MAQRYDIIHIDFQANARNANAAIESMRQESERCNKQVKDLQKKLKDGIKANLPSSQIQKLRDNLDAATKQARQFNKAYGELAKGMRVLDQGIKVFNDGSLATMNAAFQKAVYNAAKLTRSRLDRTSASYKKDREEMTALMDATQQYYASIQTDTQKVLDTISKGGKVSRQALTEELQQQKELLNVLSEKDRGYKRTVEQVATLEYELKKMGGSYEFVRKHITDTKRVSSETLRTMYTELEQTNRAGKVSTSIMRENKQAMKEIRAEQERRVQKVLGGNLGRQSEGDIRQAIASAKELIQVYGTSSKQAQTLAAQIVNAESYLKTVGVEGARAARQQADAALQAADKYKLMQDRMSNITKLSRGAFTETQRFWQEQLDGSKRGSTAYKEAERNLKALANEQQRLNTLQLQKSAKQLERKNLGLLSEKELQASIAAAKQLAQSMKPGDQAYKDLVNNIMRAEKYVKEFGMEGQRSNRKAAEQMQAMNDNMKNITKLSDGALEETRKFWQTQRDGAERGSKAYETYEKNLNATIKRQQELATAQNKKSADTLLGGTSNLQNMGEGEIRKAIDAAREYQKTLIADSEAYTKLSQAIFGAEEYLRKYGIEADKARLKEQQLKDMMTQRLTSLMTLSDSALAETKKFWQGQMQGAERTSVAYKEAEANIKRITEVEDNHRAASAMHVMAKPGNYSDAEIRQAANAMEKLRDAQAHGSEMWERYNRLVEQGRKYLDDWGKADSIMKFEGQMQKLTALSDSALSEAKKFWAEMVAGTEKGSAELAGYEANLEKVTQEERERRQLNNEMKVQRIMYGGGYFIGNSSESEIRQAIEAGKQLLQTYPIASAEAYQLSKDIVRAETQLKKYGLEAERSAAREEEAVEKAAKTRADANKLMSTQLQQGTALTETALKAQRQYWQRLIDDPKTAATSLKEYQANLAEVQRLQRQQVQMKGEQALDFFRGDMRDASVDEIRKQSEALKQFRDTLPSKTYADLILEINNYLAKTGQVAQKSSQQLMSLSEAFNIGVMGLSNSFKGTSEQLQQAKKVLQEAFAQTPKKDTAKYEQLRRALDGVALEEKRVGGLSKEMQAIIDKPKGRSFNELKVAVEQGRKALNDMSRTTKEGQKAYDELAEKVRNADLEMKNLGNESKGTTSAFEKAVSRLKTYITLYMGTAVAIQKIGGAMGDMMTLSDKMGEVRKTTGFTADQVGRLSDNLAKLDTRTPIQDLMDMAAAAGQLGLNTEEDVRGFTEAANMLHVALPEMGEEGATEMMKVALATGEVNKIRKQMEDGTVEGSSATAVAMEKVASTIDRLRATTAAAAQPIADFVKRVGAVGAQSGITVDQVAALGATVDELGMGTEMAATAISRMIPAIKNHAFDIARAIGVTPDTIRRLYDTGHAMDVIVMILKHIKENNMQNDPNGIEKLLGTGGMQEIMKELDQQGARAGIVFAGLSQHVDELQRNLGTANTAYKQGTAILNEYNKMNDTTAAKWERLKNQIQEVVVNNSMQKFMGGVIDTARFFVNIITDDGPLGKFFRLMTLYLIAMKRHWAESIGTGLMWLGKLIFTTKASTAATVADTAAKQWSTTATVALGEANEAAAVKTNIFAASWGKLNKAQKANVIMAVAAAVWWLGSALWDAHKKAREAAKQMDVMADVEKKAKQESVQHRAELRRLYEATQDQTKSFKERKKALHDMVGDAQYNKYYENLSTESELANAAAKAYHQLAAKILETARARALDAKAEELEKKRIELEDKRNENAEWRKTHQKSYDKENKSYQSRKNYAKNVTGGAFSAFTESQVARRGAAASKPAIVSQYEAKLNEDRELANKTNEIDKRLAQLGKRVQGTPGLPGNGDNGNNGNNGGNGGNGNGGTGGGGTDKNNPWGANPSAASTDWKKFNANELVARRKQMNDFVKSLQGDTDVESVLAEDPALMQAIKNGKVKSDADSVINWYNTQRLAIQNVLHSRFLTNTGNWQDPKQAHRRAKSISKLVKDDMAYYMDELDAYYTEQKSQIENAQNSGEITEEEGWRRMLQNEQVYRQKRAELQQLYSKNSKEVTQQEADTIYEILADRTGDSVAFIKSNIGTTVNLIKQVGDKSAPAMRKIYGDLDKGVEQDFLKMRTAVKKQLDAIEEIVSKERPFDGIVKNLRQNVEKMGVIYTDLDKRKEKILLSGKGYGSDEMQNLNAEYGTQRNPRLTFLLQQSEDAYSMTWERMANDMRVSGFEDWLDAINSNANADELKEALLAQLRTVYDTVQDAIKREASEVKKQVDIAWNDTTVAGDISMKQLYEKASSALGMEQSSVSRANSLINAGPASERVADRLAIKQMQVQLNMQDHYYALVRKTGQQRIDDLERQAKLKEEQGKLDEAEQLRLDAKHAKMSLNLTLSEEEADLAKQRADLAAKAEESENRLYTSLKEWGTLLSSSMQSLFEASNTGAADYYNNLAKMRLTGEGSAGGAYVVIDNAGTKDAAAHYENLDGEEALKRQLEIEQHNSVADAWKKVMDDINKKISDQITDWMNAALQTQSIDANTAALEQNTAALYATRPYETNDFTNPDRDKNGMAIDKEGKVIYPIAPEENPQNDNDPSTWPRARRKRAGLPVDGEPMDETTPIWQMTPEQREEYEQNIAGLWTAYKDYGISAETEKAEALQDVPGYTPDIRSDEQMESIASQNMQVAQSKIDASNAATQVVIANNKKQQQSTADTQGKEVRGTKSTFAAMAAAMNMYGIAYQTMSNDNMSSTQKFLTFALQSAGQVAIAMLTTNMLQTDAQSKVELPGILGKAASQLGPIAGPIAFAAMTATLGGLMALAMSKVSKSKSQIAQVTGASVSAGRLSTGMLTYAEGNVNEFTDPSSLTPGQQYNVDAADGKTYRARYMGANPTTHLTNGPEFHLVGERGREAIIDANTTRQIQMNDTGIWQAIQTLYNGGRVRATRQRGGGMSNFADGNLDEFADGASAQGSAGSAQPAFTDMLAAIQASLDRNSEVMEKAVSNGIKGVFNVYGKGGIIDSYDTGKKNVERYGEKY